MSYILDALRKSEAQRRLGQSPDLASAPPGQRPPPRSHRRRIFVAGGVLALVAATSVVLLITDRYSERGDLADAPSGPPSVEPSSALVSSAEEGLAGDPTTTSMASEAPAAEPSAPVDRRSPDQRPATVVSRPAVRRPGEQSLSAGERERLVESIEEAQRLIDAELAATAAAAGAGAEQVPVLSRPQSAAAPASLPAPEPEPPGWAPERAEFMRVWELPLAVRRDLPELDLSIHVYSVEPGRRFVLINGERRLEGDALGEDTRLVEIRRDGALVDFRDYRFLLEP